MNVVVKHTIVVRQKMGKQPASGHHGVGCDMASNVTRSNDEGDEETNEIEMSSDFEIAWNYVNMSLETICNQDDGIEDNTGRNKKIYTAKPSIERKSKIGISTILKCAEFGMLEEQNYFVNVPGDGLKLLKDIVVELGKIDDSCLNQNLFFWGKIHRFNNTWINTQYANNIGIRVDDPIQENFWRIYKDKIMKLLHDKKCSIIIFGKAKKSERGNYYIILKDMKYFHARKSRI